MNGWIFQYSTRMSNVDDIRVANDLKMKYVVQQHADLLENAVGDHVFIWRTDKGERAIVGRAIVSGPSVPRGKILDGYKEWTLLGKSVMQEVGPMVPLDLEKWLPPAKFIKLHDIGAVPVLCDLTILKMAQHTNYLLTAAQWAALDAMWSSR